MRFLETPIFTEGVKGLLDHDGYYALQSSFFGSSTDWFPRN